MSAARTIRLLLVIDAAAVAAAAASRRTEVRVDALSDKGSAGDRKLAWHWRHGAGGAVVL
jgi:hypothetical protein